MTLTEVTYFNNFLTMGPLPTLTIGSDLSQKGTEFQINPRHSISTGFSKGLLNKPGQNNCFLNSAVQVLWHLDTFRRNFRDLNGHFCTADSCIFCALKELFGQLQYSYKSALPPDALRRALAETFQQRRFKLGVMDDAAECFENILQQIHFHIANQESEDMCSLSHCIPHQKFAMTLVEQNVCQSCGATCESLSFTQMVHYVTTSALRSQATLVRNQHRDPADVFGQLLKRAGAMGDTRVCPSACGARTEICQTLMNHPEVVSVGLVWDSEKPTSDQIKEVFHSIGMELKLQDMFHSVVDYHWASSTKHHLVGIVTYYGKHYSTFFFHTKLRIWIYFDDASVREVGPRWEQVIEKCRRGHFQPLLLLYANPNCSPISSSTAPTSITVVDANKVPVAASGSINSAGNTEDSGMICFEDDNHQRTTIPQVYKINCSQKSRILNECDSLRNLVYNSNCMTSGHRSFEIVHHQLLECSTSLPKFDSNAQCFINLGQQYGGQLDINVAPSVYVKEDTAHPLPSFNTGKQPSINHIDKSCGHNPNLHSQRFHRSFFDESLIVPDSKQFSLDSDSVNQHKTNPEGSEDHGTYISRKAVQSVLTAQKLQRQRSLNGSYCPSIRNHSSSISLESFDNIDKTLNNAPGLRTEVSKAAITPRRRDSGNWSGDRNSSSSSSSTSLDSAFFYVVGNKKPEISFGSLRNIECEMRSGQQEYINMGADGGYDSLSLSSTDSYPPVIGSPAKIEPHLAKTPEQLQDSYPSVIGSSAKIEPHFIKTPEQLQDSCPSVILSPAKIEPHLVKTVEQLQDSYSSIIGSPAKIEPHLVKTLEQLQDSCSSVIGSSAKIEPRLTQIPEDLETVSQQTGTLKPHTPGSSNLIENNNSKTKGEDCDKLCAEADFFLVKSHEKENEGDLFVATALAESAAAKARAAMDSPYNNPQSLVSAKIRHSFCVMRSSSLHKCLKEAEMEGLKRQKEFTHIDGRLSQQCSQDSTYGRCNCKDCSSGSHSRESNKNGPNGKQFMPDVDEKTLELYTTLAKTVSKQRDQNNHLAASSEAHEEEKLCTSETCCQGPDQEEAMTGLKDRIRSKEYSKKLVCERNKIFHLEKCSELKDQSGNSTRSDENYCTKDLNLTEKVYCEQNCSNHPLPKVETLGKPDDILIQFRKQSNKNQHKTRKKLLGVLTHRKNRSLPDLRQGQDQSESVSHYSDDSLVLQTPLSSNSLDYKLTKNVNSPSDFEISRVSKGFHQPRLAFVKRNGEQQQSLVEVTPPHVEMLMSEPSKEKSGTFVKYNYDFPPSPPDHTLLVHSPDVLTLLGYNWENQVRDSPSPTHSDQTCLSVSFPTEERSYSTFPHQDLLKNVEIPVHPQPELSEKEFITASSHTFEDNAGILVQQEELLQERENNAEDTSKRRTDGSQNHKSVTIFDGFTNLHTSNQIRRENSWLQELKTKHFQVQRKSDNFHDKTPLTETETRNSEQSLVQKQAEVVNKQRNEGQLGSNQNNILPASKLPQTTSAVNASPLMITCRNTIDEDKGKRYASVEKTLCSVRDLTSRFETVLSSQESPTSFTSNNVLTQSTFESQKNQNSVNIRSKSSLIERNSADQTSGQRYSSRYNNNNIHGINKIIVEAHSLNDTHLFTASTPCNIQLVSSERSHSLVNHGTSYHTIGDNPQTNCHQSFELKHPECPPDYHTAIQRIKILKDCSTQNIPSLSPSDQQYNTFSIHTTQNISSLLPTTNSITLHRTSHLYHQVTNSITHSIHTLHRTSRLYHQVTNSITHSIHTLHRTSHLYHQVTNSITHSIHTLHRTSRLCYPATNSITHSVYTLHRISHLYH
ncbi:uncharacterized protein LOC143256178 [Tachypleus tridentatus]|uniref:uncharacterized protein LOC143256178 n=1 Tax=Tachypleus tridentatus TaxID=6853 RepID=UPI003FD154B4